MGQEISQPYNRFVQDFNRAIQNQALSPAERQNLQQDLEQVENPHLKNLGHVVLDQAELQAASGVQISPMPLMQDSLIEADMRFLAKDQKIIPTGKIQLKQEMMQRLIEKLLTDSLEMKDVSFEYNPGDASYTLKGKYQIDYCPDPEFSLTLKPSVQDSHLVFTI